MITYTAAELQDLNGRIGREMTAACKDPATGHQRLIRVLRLAEDAALLKHRKAL